MLECYKRNCDKCPIRFKCYTTKDCSNSPFDTDFIEVTREWMMENLSYNSENHSFLVWRDSSRADKSIIVDEIFGGIRA